MHNGIWIFTTKVKLILLDETYLNGCMKSYFCFNFQYNLFIIVDNNLHYKQIRELVETIHMRREFVRREIVKQSHFVERKVSLYESVITFCNHWVGYSGL